MAFGARQQQAMQVPPPVTTGSLMTEADLPARGAHDVQNWSAPSKAQPDDPRYMELENALSKYANGEVKARELHKLMPNGYKANLRGKYGPFEVLTPDGNYIYVQP